MLNIPSVNPAARANTCRNKYGNARPFFSLPTMLRNQIDFTIESDGSGLALWVDGDGEEPPPYWIDEQRHIHNL